MVKTHPTYKNAWYAIAVTRIMLGLVFLWAFIDKTFGLGFSTPSDQSWLAGGSPTSGFLQFGVNPDSPLVGVFQALAGQGWVDVLFMLGMLGLGLALVLGIGLRIAAVTGTLLLVMMWLALVPLDSNPIMDNHLIYAALLWVVALSRREWSLVDWWLSLKAVNKRPWLW